MASKEISPEKREKLRENWRRYYEAHPEFHKARRIQGQKSNSDFIDSHKTVCARCGNTDKRVLDFHHLDETTKLFTLASRRVAGYKKSTILEEINKCEVLCANCHRIKHWEQDHENE